MLQGLVNLPKYDQVPKKRNTEVSAENAASLVRFTLLLITIEAWKPVHFNYPTITPLATDPLSMKPIPYRPFRAGEYPFVLCNFHTQVP